MTPNSITSTTHRLVLMALLTATTVVLSRFLSIPGWNFKIGFSFLPIVIGAVLLGPLAGAIIAGTADFLGALLFPIAPYFVGFSITAFVCGWVYGVFLHKNHSLKHIIIAVLSTEILCSLIMNTFWISFISNAPFAVILPPRLIQSSIMLIVEILSIRFLLLYLPQFKRMKLSH